MLEELLTNTTLSPVLIGVAAIAAIIAFVIGRLSNGGPRKREEALKRDLLDAKASVPQLESSVRNRDAQIARLTEEINEVSERASDLLREQDRQANALRSAEREVRNLTSELNAVRGIRTSDDNLVMDGFDDEVAAEPGDSKIATQLKNGSQSSRVCSPMSGSTKPTRSHRPRPVRKPPPRKPARWKPGSAARPKPSRA
jgi:TolA-binding protein